MTSLDVIDHLTIASPCHASWNGMQGDDRARFCGLCEKHVYNIAAMTSTEVESLIRRTEGHFCARLYRRRDGTVLTADCPVGARALAATRLRRLLTLTIVGLGFLLTFFLRPAGRRSACPAPAPSGSGVTLEDWNDMGPRNPRRPPADPSAAAGPRPDRPPTDAADGSGQSDHEPGRRPPALGALASGPGERNNP